MREPDDDPLLARACAGDADAFAYVATRYGPPVRALCARMVGDADADDLAQDTLVRAFVNIGRFDPSRPVLPWLLTIARRACIDVLRRRPGDSPAEARERPHDASGPEELAAARQEIAVLRDQLLRLADGPREALVLFHVDGLTYNEIAAVLDVPLGTVMTWLHRGRAQLKQRMEA